MVALSAAAALAACGGDGPTGPGAADSQELLTAGPWQRVIYQKAADTINHDDIVLHQLYWHEGEWVMSWQSLQGTANVVESAARFGANGALVRSYTSVEMALLGITPISWQVAGDSVYYRAEVTLRPGTSFQEHDLAVYSGTSVVGGTIVGRGSQFPFPPGAYHNANRDVAVWSHALGSTTRDHLLDVVAYSSGQSASQSVTLPTGVITPTGFAFDADGASWRAYTFLYSDSLNSLTVNRSTPSGEAFAQVATIVADTTTAPQFALQVDGSTVNLPSTIHHFVVRHFYPSLSPASNVVGRLDHFVYDKATNALTATRDIALPTQIFSGGGWAILDDGTIYVWHRASGTVGPSDSPFGISRLEGTGWVDVTPSMAPDVRPVVVVASGDTLYSVLMGFRRAGRPAALEVVRLN